jgi:RNA polymerase sigma-70 factor (ECF subfamily)
VRVNGLSHTEVADRLGVSKSLVEKYLARLVQHCRARLREAEDRAPSGLN